MTKSEQTTKNQMNAVKIQDAISDLSVVDTLIERGRNAEARAELFKLWKIVTDVIGGDSITSALCNQFLGEHCKRYAVLAR